jgi:hypothetical protein
MTKLNIKLFKELRKASDQQNEFHLIKTPSNPVVLMSELYELDDKGCIKLDVNKFNYENDHSISVEASGRIIKRFSVV